MRVGRGMSRRAITGEEDMNKAELGARLATECSLTRATADRMVRAVFAAIGESLANEDPTPAPVSGPSASGRARLARGARTGATIPIAATRTDCDDDARRCSGVDSLQLAVSRPDNRNSRRERPAPAGLLRWEPR